MIKILVVGVSGMLGSTAYRFFASSKGIRVTGTARSLREIEALPRRDDATIIGGVDATDIDSVIGVIGTEKPDVVINCVGVIKQLASSKSSLTSIAINSLFPHRLAQICAASNARLIQISTDCVFAGDKGNYRETDIPDAHDLYGRSKLLGEVDYPHAITLRTSIIGHELGRAVSLIDWFLSQPGPRVSGYHRAIYSGFPTIELVRIIRDFVIPKPELHGLWHVASAPINKFDLLTLVKEVYGKTIEIVPDDSLVIDRSLDGSRFNAATGYAAPSWRDLMTQMNATR
ncbi:MULTISPECIES: dTDP-4-dehydrorhamnose reductase family protein [Bradyrhizobium]|uniref:dTDP-4-dehydrorhamnose reductase n=2 Tax=Bradyrhizobium TaxID=374 RepID=A0ABY0Q8W1_9BRAD|nr:MULTISPECIES: SDR family oxidoreductase [Bradyrhizobium]SDJ71559.1 dTDP-4-dehydrorhamnose reductase [Bradyrhizobium ottawaense]SEC21892.1 dTDP-4-dehydrorhamnose reductase [Bradyrhizobium lablabi]